MKKQVITYFEDFDPLGSYHNLLSGYALGQKWHNSITGDEFFHESDGVWEKFSTTTDLNTAISNLELLSIAYAIAL